MDERAIWTSLQEKSIAQTHPFDRDFIWIKKEDFEPLKQYFVREVNIVHLGENYRSRSLIKHLHAVYQGDHVFVHPDTGNIARLFPLGLLHLTFDVIPYALFSLLKRTPLQTIFKCPKDTRIM